MESTTAEWAKTYVPELTSQPIAYFSSEIKIPGFHNLYAGGLGILAGEFVEGLSQIGLPVVAFSLLYKKRQIQKMNLKTGETLFEMEDFNFKNLPLRDTTKRIVIKIQGREVHARIWDVKFDAAHVFLLDTDVEENEHEMRKLTELLYREEGAARLRQEIVLGRGGLLALDALDITPAIIHLNDSATAFAFLKDDLARFAGTRIVYTTHTVKTSSIRRYSRDLLIQMAPDLTRLPSFQKFIEDFHGTVNLHHGALGASDIANAVSEEHGRATLREYFATFSEKLISITNGIDLKYWMDPELARDAGEGKLTVDKWREVKAKAKKQLVDLVNRETFGPQLGPDFCFKTDVFTITVARRFQDYKRNTLILKHLLEILRRLAPHELQIIFAGKPHPTDDHAMKMFELILSMIQHPPAGARIAYWPNYDVESAQVLVQGSDAWLNNPEVPYEASGTSYQKAMVNGTLLITTETGGPLQHTIDCRVDTEKGNAFRIAEFVGPYHLPHELVVENFIHAILHSAELFYENSGEFAEVALRSMNVAPEVDVRRMARDYALKMYLPAVLTEGAIGGIRSVALASAASKTQPHGTYALGEPITFTLEVEMKRESCKDLPRQVQAELWFGFHGQKYNPAPAQFSHCQGNLCYYRGDVAPPVEGVYYYTARCALFDPRVRGHKVYRWKEGAPHQDPHFVVSAKLPQETRG